MRRCSVRSTSTSATPLARTSRSPLAPIRCHSTKKTSPSATSFSLRLHRLHLIARFTWYQGVTKVLVAADLAKEKPRPVAPKSWLSEDEVQRHLTTVTAYLNAVLHTFFSLTYCDDPTLTLRAVGGLLGVAFLCRILGSAGFLFLLFLGAFAIPKFYQLKQPEVDAALEAASKHASKQVEAALEQGKDLLKKMKSTDAAQQDEKKKL
jgi:hypothetical protein